MSTLSNPPPFLGSGTTNEGGEAGEAWHGSANDVRGGSRHRDHPSGHPHLQLSRSPPLRTRRHVMLPVATGEGVNLPRMGPAVAGQTHGAPTARPTPVAPHVPA